MLKKLKDDIILTGTVRILTWIRIMHNISATYYIRIIYVFRLQYAIYLLHITYVLSIPTWIFYIHFINYDLNTLYLI